MLDKITIIKEILQNNIKLAGRKPAKLSAMPKFKTNTKKIMDSVVSTPVNENITETKKEDSKISQPQVEMPKQPDAVTITLPGIEECQKRLNNVGAILTEKDDINKLVSTRKLRSAPRVSKVMCFINGNINKVSLKQPITSDKTEEKKETFDFSKSFKEVGNNNIKQEDTQDEKPYSWLRNEETIATKKDDVDDKNVVEYQALIDQNATTADSLATQKEILMNLRKKVEKNNALCEAKKRELMEENMALTQELNDVLAEINQLSDTVTQQEAFLGIDENNEDENNEDE